MRAGRRLARGQRAIAEVLAEVLLVAMVVTLVTVLIAFFAPLIPTRLDVPLGSAVGLGVVMGSDGRYVIPIAYASGAPALSEVDLFVQSSTGGALPGVSWEATVQSFHGTPLGVYLPGVGWTATSTLGHLLTAGDRFVLVLAGPAPLPSGCVFGLSASGGWTGMVSVQLP